MGRQSSKNSPVPTLIHVARLAGVGLGTASRALSGQGSVSNEMLERVRTAAKQLGYQRNELARNLKVKRSGAIGLVIPDIGGKFMASCVREIQRVLRNAEYTCIITFTDGDEAIEAKEIDYLTRHQVDGLLVIPSASRAAHYNAPQLRNIPIVAFDQPIDMEQFDSVLVKNRQGALEGVTHLSDHGHKRIACIAVNGHLYSMRQRMAGYRAAMRAARLPPMLEVVEPDQEHISRQIDLWLNQKHAPTAIFSLNELTSQATVAALSERGIKMPDDIAFVGFDDIKLGPYLEPALTAVVQPAEELGACAAKRLLERIASEEYLLPKQQFLDTKLIVRGSCGCSYTKIESSRA